MAEFLDKLSVPVSLMTATNKADDRGATPEGVNQVITVLFAEKDGARSSAQIKAFEDTWQWDQVSARAYQEVVEAGGKVSQAMQAFDSYLGPNDMLAYLAMMAPRLVELRRVRKPTGSCPCSATCLMLLTSRPDAAILTPETEMLAA